MENKSNEFYESLWEIHNESNASLTVKYRLLRELLERLCRSQMQDESLQMTDLSARISFLSARAELEPAEQNRLHSFRLTSNDILNDRAEPEEAAYLRDLKAISFTVRKVFGQDIPLELYKLLPKSDITFHTKPTQSIRQQSVKRLRVCFQYADEYYLYVTPANIIVDEPIKVCYHIIQKNEEFDATVAQLWRHAQLNLLDVSISEEGIYTPEFIVLEPDYLIDISSLAECFRDYGSHPANYCLSKLIPIENARPLLLGNIANLFLDEWIHADGEVDYVTCMKKAFRKYPIEIAACEDLLDGKKEQEFFSDCKMHFQHIRDVVTDTFHASGYDLNTEDAVLEPAYICEALGLQGRLDYMQRDMSSFIEMKSGKADEYAIRGKIEPKENNKIQMLLYMAVLEYSMGQDHRRMRPYLLYTRYPLLYPARPSWTQVKRAINLRNLIVAEEYGVQLHNNTEYTSSCLKGINAETLNEKKLSGKFWEQYLRPSIDKLKQKLEALSLLEQDYYFTLYNFITKEQYTSKSGDVDHEGRTGAAALWLSTLAEKREAGEILYDLKITDNHAADVHAAYVVLSVPDYDDEFLPNFRVGDVVVLYERNDDEDLVTNKLVFKGALESIIPGEIRVRIRATQRNTSVLPANSLYAIEHDTMDTAFRCMYQGLYTFADTNKERRDLLLSQRQPRFDAQFAERIDAANDDFTRVTLKAQAAQDYFLLVGPPGTGKTSRALKQMVETFYANPDTQILLLAYTNRAVDEICKSLSFISPEVDYIRVGSELSCEEMYRGHLIENILSTCNRRAQVYDVIARNRIIVGTVAAVSSKPELFRLKTFDVAIVDEATQILEPQLLGILCARNRVGADAVGKFILIGDHKQLPAVVLQNERQSRVHSPLLQEIGIANLRDSLFERLYRRHHAEVNSWAVDMLYRQGRMNPVVALFPNHAFYGGKLQPVGLPHQLDELSEDCLMNKRVAFIPSVADKGGTSCKTNRSEAKIVAKMAACVYGEYKNNFNSFKTLGIITPYRSQIALIKKELSLLGVAQLNEILVDTVERFQGSERDVIIYSFSVNYPYQLKYLANVIEEDGMQIDRKLNVALTRARKQLFITGVTEVLERNNIYRDLLKLIKERGGFTSLCNS